MSKTTKTKTSATAKKVVKKTVQAPAKKASSTKAAPAVKKTTKAVTAPRKASAIQASKPAKKDSSKTVSKDKNTKSKTGIASATVTMVAKLPSKTQDKKDKKEVVVQATPKGAPKTPAAPAQTSSERGKEGKTKPIAPSFVSAPTLATYSKTQDRVPSMTLPKANPKLANNWKNKPVESLSDEEILAMPESEYMNHVQLEFFRKRLLQLKRDVITNAGATTEHLREENVVVPDPADRATIEEEHALELRTRDRERKLLKKIDQAVMLIDTGEYGYCEETGEPIGVPRLLARPTATLSIEAQQRRELKQKLFGD